MKNLELTFTKFGTLELTDGDDILWSSDEDEEFRDEFTDEFLTPENDMERVIDWLTDNRILTQDEASSVEVFSEDESDIIETDD